MKIDYYCFATENSSFPEYQLDSNDNENVAWIKTKYLEEIDYAKKIGKLLIYSIDDDKFFHNGKEVNIKEKTIFPRCFIFHVKKFLPKLEENEANSLVKFTDTLKIEEWPKYIQPLYRNATVTTFSEFKKNYKYYLEKYKKIFLKTCTKSFSSPIEFIKEIELPINSKKIPFLCIQPSNQKAAFSRIESQDKIIVSSCIELVPDPENNKKSKEYRAFVLNGKLANISRSYLDESTKVPEQVKNIANYIVDEINTKKFIKNYSFDLFEIKFNNKHCVDIVEFNSLESTGREIDNSIFTLENEQSKEF